MKSQLKYTKATELMPEPKKEKGLIIIKMIGKSLPIFLLLNNAFATAYQPIFAIAYDNPANLYSIDKASLILGNTYINSRLVYTGVNGPLSGTAISNESYNYPYGRIAYRVNPDLAIGFDVTHRIYLNIQFPIGSILQSSTTSSILFDVDYSPRFCYKMSDKLFIGAGANFDNLYMNQINFVVEPYGNLANQLSSWGTGWDAGIIYKFSEKTIANFNYFSQISQTASGTSTWGPQINKNLKLYGTVIPAIATLMLYQEITQKLAINAGLRYQFWDAVNQLNLVNTALGNNITIPLNYNNTYVTMLNGQYQFTDTLMGVVGAEFNNSPASLFYRRPGLPASSALAVFARAEILVTKSCTAKLSYAHAFANPSIDTIGRSGAMIGKENINDNIVDISLHWSF